MTSVKLAVIQLAAFAGVMHDLGRPDRVSAVWPGGVRTGTGGIVTFTVEGVPAQEVQRHLAGKGVNTSVSLAEYARFDLPHRGLPDLVRASVHYYNTGAELDRLTAALLPPCHSGRSLACGRSGSPRAENFLKRAAAPRKRR